MSAAKQWNGGGDARNFRAHRSTPGQSASVEEATLTEAGVVVGEVAGAGVEQRVPLAIPVVAVDEPVAVEVAPVGTAGTYTHLTLPTNYSV